MKFLGLLMGLMPLLATGALISKDCMQMGSDYFFKNPTSTATSQYYTCSPKQCTMVTNSASQRQTTKTIVECAAAASGGSLYVPSSSTILTGLSSTTCATYSYAFSKDEVFKNVDPKTCVDKDYAAATYPETCSRSALKKNFGSLGHKSDGATGAYNDVAKAHVESGVRLAYCNDQYLVIHTVNVPNHAVGLLDNPHPPGDFPGAPYDPNTSGCSGTGITSTSCDGQGVTRSNMVQYSVYKIPLKPRDLGTSAVTNNMGRFSETFTAPITSITTASSTSTVVFGQETAGYIHSGYVVCTDGTTCSSTTYFASKTVLKQCDSGEIVTGDATTSTTLNVGWTIWGTVCVGEKDKSSCAVTGDTTGKYVKISNAWVKITNCNIKGGSGTCTLASAQTIAAGTTLYVKNSNDEAVTCILSAAATTTTLSGATTASGSHSATTNLPAYTEAGTKYYPGIPIYGPLSIAVTGQVIYPIYDDKGYTSQEMCEVDTCNAHAGIGYDYHYHGDPYHHTPGVCMYSPKDYTDSVYGHPPLIGYGLDGYKVYGRHLNETNIGYTTALDDCGGHSHGTGIYKTYHYHSQVVQLSALASSILAGKASTGTSYYAPVGGVYKCWRGDIGTSRLFGAQGNSIPSFDKRPDFEDIKPCSDGTSTTSGQKHYWAHSSLQTADSGNLDDLLESFYKFNDYFSATFADGATSIMGDVPTAAPVTITATLSFTLTSSLTADQITASASIQTALKSSIAVMLEIDVSSVTAVTATAATRKKRTAAEAQRELDAGIIAIDWREHQAEDVTRILGYGFEVTESNNGLVVKHTNDLAWRRMAVSAVTITATVTSAYSASALSAANSAYGSVFTTAFTAAAASYGISVYEPTLAPTKAPTADDSTSTSTSTSTTNIIIGVVVGVGGFLILAGAAYAIYMGACSGSASSSTNAKMPVESSHHQTHAGHVDEGGVEVELALTHADNGHVQGHARHGHPTTL